VTVIPRVFRGGASALSLAALLGAIFLLIGTAYYPFQWDPPRVVHNDVTRDADGALRFGEMNRARTTGTPDWLADARRSGTLQIELEINPQSTQQQSPASFMMVARDFWHSDLAIGQDHSELLVWLRRPGSDANGNPAFKVPGVLQPGQWNRVEVLVRGRVVEIDVDGARRVTDHLSHNPLSSWGTGQVALGGEVHGGGAWEGQIAQAEVRTPGHTVDYVRPGALSIPSRFFYLPDHVAPFPPIGRGEWVAAFLHFLSFIPVGFLIVRSRRPPVRPAPATLLAVALAVALAGGKFLFHDRHTEVTDLIVQTAGALLGALLAWRRAHGHV
jgi:hypothetical protein